LKNLSNYILKEQERGAFLGGYRLLPLSPAQGHKKK